MIFFFRRVFFRNLAHPGQKVVFSTCHDHSLKNMLKGSSAPADLFGKEPFSEMLKQLDDVVDSYTHKTKKTEEEVEPATLHAEELSTFLPEGVESVPEEHEQAFVNEIQEATALVDRFIKFIPETSSKTELVQALEGTAVAKKQPEGTTALIVMDTKTCGESSSQPHLRYPQFRNFVLKNAVQAFCAVRNQEQLESDELCAVLDGSRQIATSIMQCFVRDDGVHFENKTRSEFVIVFEEKSMKARKQLNRGLVQVHEGMHVMTNGPLTLPAQRVRLYGGSNMTTTIGPVVLDPLENLWLLPAEKKKLYEGGKAKVLAGGGMPDAPQKPDLKAGDPMTFHSMPVKFFRELLHSFCAGMVFLTCDPDGVGCMAAILSKIPCVAIVYTAEHAAALRSRLIEFTFNEFQSQSSPLYRVNVTLGIGF